MRGEYVQREAILRLVSEYLQKLLSFFYRIKYQIKLNEIILFWNHVRKIGLCIRWKIAYLLWCSYAIFRVASSPKSKKMSSTINSYACALIGIWKRSFDDQHVGSRISVVYKLEKLTTEYYNHVYVKLHRKSDTHKKTNVKKKLAVSSSQLNKQWRASRMGKSGKKTSIREIKYSCRVWQNCHLW